MSNITGDRLKVHIFGQSHSKAIGVTIEGLPAGLCIDMDRLYAFMERRAPGRSALTTARREADKPEFISGLADGRTCGAPLTCVIWNQDARSG
ncbi:MAG TPA: chorismate synthase, partial [Lachnospiraceae bacterium]|nr:chorismate synthase [Lachnospiraceae bacterium]